MNITGAVLAGGRSRRFGQPKACFELAGKPMLLHTLDALQPICAERLVVAKPDTPLPPLPPDVRLVFDEREIQHPLSGILTALRHARFEWVFLCAVDMPFLNPVLIEWMASLVCEPDGALDVVVPESEARLQPLHALYHRGVQEKLASIAQGLSHVSETAIKPPAGVREQKGEGGPLPSLQAILRHPSLRVRVIAPEEWRRYDPEGRSFENLNTPSAE